MALVMILVLIFYKPSRKSYGPVSLVFAMAIGTFRTGMQGLWGCSVNLLVNVDGKGFKSIPQEHLEWMKAKRRELGLLGLTTFVGILIVTFAVALIVERDQFSGKHAASILIWNISGLVVGAALSAASRWEDRISSNKNSLQSMTFKSKEWLDFGKQLNQSSGIYVKWFEILWLE